MNASSSDPILFDIPAPKVARITLNRPHRANAQDTELLYALNSAFDRAAQDSEINVILLTANGKNFSAGHDLSEKGIYGAMKEYRQVAPICGFECAGAEPQMAREEEIYLGFSERWRNIPKPTIAAVQGKCVAAGLMLIWPCDIIIASEDALFSDPTLSFGIPGHEYFTHVWELGMRRAKEILFTSESFTAEQAREWGMVNQVVPREELQSKALELAVKIAARSSFALKLVKKALNGVHDAQGRQAAMNNAFHLHQLAHTHNLKLFDSLVDPTGLPAETRKAMKME